MTTRQVRINGTEITVAVPIYITDWVKAIAVDADGEIWMYADAPTVQGNMYNPIMLAAGFSRAERLPAPGSERDYQPLDMTGINWLDTLTYVNPVPVESQGKCITAEEFDSIRSQVERALIEYVGLDQGLRKALNSVGIEIK